MSLELQARNVYKLCFIQEVPIDELFRFRRQTYRVISKKLARNIKPASSDFIDIADYKYSTALCAVNTDLKEDWL